MSQFVQPWERGGEIRDFDRLNERLGELELILREFHRRLANGPVPGAYFPISIDRAGAVAVAPEIWRLRVPSELRPILVSIAVKSGTGDVTLDLRDDGLSVLTTPATTVSGLRTLRSRTDFATEKIAANSILSLAISSISGAPQDLAVLLVFKGVGKMEPT